MKPRFQALGKIRTRKRHHDMLHVSGNAMRLFIVPFFYSICITGNETSNERFQDGRMNEVNEL
jgi:hypothetical protein